MDNNFNQMNNNQMNNQVNPQMNPQMNTQMYNQPVSANQGLAAAFSNDIKSFDLTKTLMASGAALVATILATLVWIFITGITGTFFVYIALLVGFAGVFVYEKIAKKVDLIGLIVCVVCVLIAIYFGVRYGYVYALAKEMNTTVSAARTWFELAYEWSSEVRADYIESTVLSYVCSIVYSVVVIVKKFREN